MAIVLVECSITIEEIQTELPTYILESHHPVTWRYMDDIESFPSYEGGSFVPA